MGAFMVGLAKKAGQQMMNKEKKRFQNWSGGRGGGNMGGDSANTGSGTKRADDAMAQMDGKRKNKPARGYTGR